VEVLSKALQLNPALPSAHLQLGLLQHHVGDIAAARTTLASLEIVAPNSPELCELQQAIARP
jgi:hypothetical protein